MQQLSLKRVGYCSLGVTTETSASPSSTNKPKALDTMSDNSNFQCCVLLTQVSDPQPVNVHWLPATTADLLSAMTSTDARSRLRFALSCE